MAPGSKLPTPARVCHVTAFPKCFAASIAVTHEEVSKEDLEEILAVAIEGRRRVKEQLKKMGGFEYHHTSFSYLDSATGEERFVGVPEQGGRDLISADPLFQVPGITPLLQHFFTVIAFQKNSMALTIITNHLFAGITDIGYDTNIYALRTYHKTMGIGCIMTFPERSNL